MTEKGNVLSQVSGSKNTEKQDHSDIAVVRINW